MEQNSSVDCKVNWKLWNQFWLQVNERLVCRIGL